MQAMHFMLKVIEASFVPQKLVRLIMVSFKIELF